MVNDGILKMLSKAEKKTEYNVNEKISKNSAMGQPKYTLQTKTA